MLIKTNKYWIYVFLLTYRELNMNLSEKQQVLVRKGMNVRLTISANALLDKTFSLPLNGYSILYAGEYAIQSTTSVVLLQFYISASDNTVRARFLNMSSNEITFDFSFFCLFQKNWINYFKLSISNT